MNNLEFQLYDWLEGHETNNDDSDSEEPSPGDFIIHSFGRCDNGKSVYAKITGYTPYFYILLPDQLQNKSKSELDKSINKSKSNVYTNYNYNILLNDKYIMNRVMILYNIIDELFNEKAYKQDYIIKIIGL